MITDETYLLEVKLNKIDKTVETPVPIVVNVDADRIEEIIDEKIMDLSMVKAISKEYNPCNCKYGNWKPKVKD